MELIRITEQQDNNTFTFYDSRLGTFLREFEGFEYADVVASIDELAGPYGGVYITSKHGLRVCSIKGELVGTDNLDVFAQRRVLLKALRQTGIIKLIRFTTYDGLELQFEAEVTKLVNPYTHMIHQFLIEFTAPDFRFYSQALQTANIGLSGLQGGASIPANIPMNLPLATNPTSEFTNIVTNVGSEVTDPVFKVRGPGSGILIRNITTDQELSFNDALASDEELIIDVKNRTATVGEIGRVDYSSGTNVYDKLSGDFWSIIPGQNQIRLFFDSGFVDGQSALTVEFRHAYGGI